MLKADIERMTHYYYRYSKVSAKSIKELEEADKNENISKIFEVYENGFVGKWYYIIRKKGSSFVLDYGLNNVTLNTLMKPYMEKYNSEKVNSEELKMYRKGIFPAIHKVDEDYFFKYCDLDKKVNNSEFRYLYAETSNGFVVFGDYNNKVLTAKVDTEEKAISDLVNLYAVNPVSKDDSYKYVIDDRKEKDFEMIF